MGSFFSYFLENAGTIWQRLLEHLLIVGAAMAMAGAVLRAVAAPRAPPPAPPMRRAMPAAPAMAPLTSLFMSVVLL